MKKILDYDVERTCASCPEQYEVCNNGELVGHLRLRHGHFRAEVLIDNKWLVVYEANPRGHGSFEEDERDHFITEAVHAIHNRLTKKTETN